MKTVENGLTQVKCVKTRPTGQNSFIKLSNGSKKVKNLKTGESGRGDVGGGKALGV